MNRSRIALALLIALPFAAAGLAPAQKPPEGALNVTPEPTEVPATPVPRTAGKHDYDLVPRSLAETVKKAKDQEPPAKKKSLGTITNDSLRKEGAAPAPTPAKGAGKGTAPAAPTPAAGPISTTWRDDKGRSEADWKRLVQAEQKRLSSAQAEVQRLESEVKRLENDFYAWSDGNYRDRVIKPSLDQAQSDLKKARLDVDQARAAQADLEDDARRSNTPPGWLR